MQIEVAQTEQFLEITIDGRIDATTVGDLESRALEEISNHNLAVLLNFAKVEYISSAGLRAVLKIAKATQGKKLAMRCFALQPAVFEVFKLSGFSTIIKIFDDKESAIASLR